MNNIFESWFYECATRAYWKTLTPEQATIEVLDDLKQYTDDCGEEYEFANIDEYEIPGMLEEFLKGE